MFSVGHLICPRGCPAATRSLADGCLKGTWVAVIQQLTWTLGGNRKSEPNWCSWPVTGNPYRHRINSNRSPSRATRENTFDWKEPS